MPFVKLDCGILDSTIWFDREAREVFVTALLMAVPRELTEPEPQLQVRSLEQTGWIVPSGWYGFVEAAGSGIVRRAGLEPEPGLDALERLGSPEESSRSPEYDGRRMARVNGGYLVLNFIKYRDRDHTSAVRSKRYRERKRHGVSSSSHTVASRDITQAEALAKAELPPSPPKGGINVRRRSFPKRAEINADHAAVGKNTFGPSTPIDGD